MFILEVTRNKRKTLPLTVRDANGALVDLDSKTIRFSVEQHYGDPDPATLTKETGDGIDHAADQSGAGKGLATLTFDPADTLAFPDVPFATYPAQLELEQVSNEPEVMDTGYLTVKAAVRESV